MSGIAFKTEREESSQIEPQRNAPGTNSFVSFVRSLADYAKLGAASALFLSLLELIDVHYQLTPVLRGVSERLVFSSYFSLNVAGGAAIGGIVGLCILITRSIYKLFL